MYFLNIKNSMCIMCIKQQLCVMVGKIIVFFENKCMFFCFF